MEKLRPKQERNAKSRWLPVKNGPRKTAKPVGDICLKELLKSEAFANFVCELATSVVTHTIEDAQGRFRKESTAIKGLFDDLRQQLNEKVDSLQNDYGAFSGNASKLPEKSNLPSRRIKRTKAKNRTSKVDQTENAVEALVSEVPNSQSTIFESLHENPIDLDPPLLELADPRPREYLAHQNELGAYNELQMDISASIECEPNEIFDSSFTEDCFYSLTAQRDELEALGAPNDLPALPIYRAISFNYADETSTPFRPTFPDTLPPDVPFFDEANAFIVESRWEDRPFPGLETADTEQRSFALKNDKESIRSYFNSCLQATSLRALAWDRKPSTSFK